MLTESEMWTGESVEQLLFYEEDDEENIRTLCYKKLHIYEGEK